MEKNLAVHVLRRPGHAAGCQGQNGLYDSIWTWWTPYMSARTAWDVSVLLPGDFFCMEKNRVKMEKNLVLREHAGRCVFEAVSPIYAPDFR